MAFKCIRTTFAKRIYEEDAVYASIGSADKKYFVEVEVVDDATVIEVEGSDAPDAPDAAKGPGLLGKLFGSKEGTEEEQIKAALTKLEVEFGDDADLEALKGLLLEAQQTALTS